MTAIQYAGITTYDPTTGTTFPNGQGYVYDVSDSTFTTPLAVTDLSGNAIAGNLLRSNAQGILDEFVVQDRTQVNWKSGSLVILLWSPAAYEAAFQSLSAQVNAALTQLQQLIASGGTGGGLPAGTTLDAIPDGSGRLALSSSERVKLASVAAGATAVTIGSGHTQAMAGDTTFTAAQTGAVANISGFAGIVGRTAAQGVPSASELATYPAGTYFAVDAS